MKKINVLVYDSGVGGVNVLVRLYNSHPYLNFTYISDSCNAPYGNKSVGELISIAEYNLTRAKIERFECVILACNTLSTLVLDYLQAKFNKTHFIGVYPCVDMANIKTLLLCSNATAKSPFIKNAKERFSGLDIMPMQNLIFDIEKNINNNKNINVASYFNNVGRDYNTVLLGCTHFCFLNSEIQSIFPNAQLFDGISRTYDHFYKFLSKNGYLNQMSDKKGSVSFIFNDKKRNLKVFKNTLKL